MLPPKEAKEAACKKKRKRKPASSRLSGKRSLTVVDRYNECVSMSAAYYSTAQKVLAMALGVTVADMASALDPAASDESRFDGVLSRLSAAASASSSSSSSSSCSSSGTGIPRASTSWTPAV
jgi:hypothetical protein